MANGTDIDDRWLDQAGLKRRQLVQLQERRTQLMRDLESNGKSITTISEDLGTIKDAIAKGEPFPESTKPAVV